MCCNLSTCCILLFIFLRVAIHELIFHIFFFLLDRVIVRITYSLGSRSKQNVKHYIRIQAPHLFSWMAAPSCSYRCWFVHHFKGPNLPACRFWRRLTPWKQKAWTKSVQVCWNCWICQLAPLSTGKHGKQPGLKFLILQGCRSCTLPNWLPASRFPSS